MPSRSVISIGLWVIFALSVGTNVYLVARVQVIERALANRATRLKPGDLLGALDVADVAGKPAKIAFSEATTPTVLYLLSPECKWCERNEANLRALAVQTSGRFRIIGLSRTTTGLVSYLAERQYPFPVYAARDDQIGRTLGVTGIPHTIVVSSDGHVLKIWGGAYQNTWSRELETYFDIKLPGLSPGEG